MTINVLVNGASGKMGQQTIAAINADSGLNLVAKTGSADDLGDSIKSSGAQVVVEFTLAGLGLDNTRTIIESGACPVVGTSGLLPEDIDQLTKLCEDHQRGAIIAPNFSIGAVLMMKYAQDAAKYFPNAEIIETHHDQKIDAPSGTALKTAEFMAKNRQQDPKELNDKEILKGARGGKHFGVPIHSIRLAGYVAHQEVIFGGKGERLRIIHDSSDRESFMPGVIMAVKKVITLDHLVYGLEHIL